MNKIKLILAALGFAAFVGTAYAATLSVQTTTFDGLEYTLGSANTADVFTNDGKTILVFLNASTVTRTLTISANDADKPGFGTIAVPDTTITLASSGDNGGRVAVGPFPKDRFNNSAGQVSYTLDGATDLSVAVLKLQTYQ